MPRIEYFRDTYLKRDLYHFLLCQRKDKKITQKNMGEELGVSQQWYAEKEKNADFTFGELLIIFKKLNVKTEQILKLFGV